MPDPLRHAFRNVDGLDWNWLDNQLGDSGHGRFWKATFAEIREALRSQSPGHSSSEPVAVGDGWEKHSLEEKQRLQRDAGTSHLLPDLIERLEENAEMLRDGLQLPNLTEAWHNVVMKQAAKDALEAAAALRSQALRHQSTGVTLERVLNAFDAATKTVPLGHENPQRGASTYNWRQSISAELRALAAALSAQERG